MVVTAVDQVVAAVDQVIAAVDQVAAVVVRLYAFFHCWAFYSVSLLVLRAISLHAAWSHGSFLRILTSVT